MNRNLQIDSDIPYAAPGGNTVLADSTAGGTGLQPGSPVFVNADDWGMDVDTTNRSLDCALQGTISSVSAMVFMEDSERAALLAQQHKVEAGIHLNFTKTFS
jgi:hypothetical protein